MAPEHNPQLQPSPSRNATPPPGFAPEWLRSVLATTPVRPTPEQNAQAQDATLVWLAALRAQDPTGALLAAEAVSLHLATMETLRQAADPKVPITIACRLRSNAASLTRTCLALIQQLLDWHGPQPTGGDVPDLPVLRSMLADAAPPPPELPSDPPRDPAGKNFAGATP